MTFLGSDSKIMGLYFLLKSVFMSIPTFLRVNFKSNRFETWYDSTSYQPKNRKNN